MRNLAALLLGSTALLMMPDAAEGGAPIATPPDSATPPASPPIDSAPPVATPPEVPPSDPMPAAEPDPMPPVEEPLTDSPTYTAYAPSSPSITAGRLVVLTVADKSLIGDDETCVAIVARVNDDGSINVRAFSPNGGEDLFFTGVLETSKVDAMEDGADKNAAKSVTWGWPTRA